MEHRIKQQEEPGTASVDDARIFEHGQQFRRVGQRHLACLMRGTDHFDQRAPHCGGLLRSVSTETHDGQNRALDRLQYRLVRTGRRSFRAVKNSASPSHAPW